MLKVGRFSIESIVLVLLLLAVFFAIPVTSNAFQTFEWANVAYFFLAIVGLNILTGYSGQISLGNGAFMAIGGYTSALIVYWLPQWNASFDPVVLIYLSIPLGGIVAFAGGVLIGIPALRLRGIYLALATFALALAITPLANHFYDVTRGHVGIRTPLVTPPFGLDADLSNNQWLYFFNWVIAAILFVPAYLITRSRTGRAWMAIRDSDQAAVASGVNLATYKTLAFGFSAFYAGIAGSLQVLTLAYTNPDNYALPLSLSLLIGLVIGGLASSWGPLLGAIIVVWVPLLAESLANFKVAGFAISRPDVMYGVALIVIIYFAPAGLAGLLARGVRWYGSLRGIRVPAAAAAPPVLEAPVDAPSTE